MTADFKATYLTDVPATITEIRDNFYIVDEGERVYAICPYGARDTGKQLFLRAMYAVDGEMSRAILVRSDSYEFHHIVERNHLALISCSGKLVDQEHNEMPSVMVREREDHNWYDSLIQRTTVKKMVLAAERVPGNYTVHEQKVRAMMAVADPKKRVAAQNEIKRRIQILQEIYCSTYSGEPVLQNIVRNILNEFGKRIYRRSV